MRFSTYLRVAAAVLLASPGVMAQSAVQNSTLDRASSTSVIANGGTFKPTEAPTTIAGTTFGASMLDISEGFDSYPAAIAAGWAQQNLSSPVGTTTWRQGAGGTTFPGNSGGATSYAAANFNSTGATGTISDWLFTPQTALQNGTTLKFFTRTITGAPFADRLEVRMSTAGASVNAGATATSVGDFTTLLLTINPNLATGAGGTGANGYPDVWTEFTATVSGLAAPTSGRFAFRYFVTDGGANGANSNYIGLDDVRIVVTAPTGPALAANPTSLNFGTTTPVGTPSTAQTVTLTNGGTAATTVTGITSSNPAFSVQGATFPLTIAAGGTATFTVRFTPTNTTAQTGTLSIASNAAGSPLVINVSGTGNAPPANDNIANAIVLTTPTGSISGTNANATLEAGEPAPSCQSSHGASVWWRFTPTQTGTLSVDLSATAFDTILTFHQPGTTQIGCDDDGAAAPNTLASILTNIPVTAGTPVLIRVAGYAGAGGTGTPATGTISGTYSFVGTTAGENTADAGRTSLTASPNPVQGTSRVRFVSATAQDVTVAVYDVTGRQVATLFQGAVAADQPVDASLNAASLPTGVYVVRATGTDLNLAQRVTVIR